MNAFYEPIIRRELLAVVIGRSAESVKRDVLAGKLPAFDAKVDRKLQGWRLSTLKKWNPRISSRIAALLRTPHLPAA